MTKTTGTFKRGSNAGTFTCTVCGDVRQRGNSGDNDQTCIPCWDEAGLINEHADGYHEDDATRSDSCPDCTGNAERGSADWRKAQMQPKPARRSRKAQVQAIPANLVAFSPAKRVALVRCWIGAAKTDEAKARWQAILPLVEAAI